MTKQKQSYENFQKTLKALEKSLIPPPTEERDFAGIIQSFEFTYELLWKTLKHILEANGVAAPFPRVTFEEAYKRSMIEGNEIWKEIMDARNQTVHTYDETLAHTLCEEIGKKYLIIFQKTAILLKKFVQ